MHNISESALALYDDNRKETAQTMNQKLCHHFTMGINKRYFTSLKLSFGKLVNISDSIIYLNYLSQHKAACVTFHITFEL